MIKRNKKTGKDQKELPRGDEKKKVCTLTTNDHILKFRIKKELPFRRRNTGEHHSRIT